MAKLIFSREKYMKDKGLLSYIHNKYWVNKCNGKEVKKVTGKYECGIYIVNLEWCNNLEEH
ncbi:hypothetical protein [Clostridium amylolyticum]|nr:hypothetical protein [Clostridium amylolyticum]